MEQVESLMRELEEKREADKRMVEEFRARMQGMVGTNQSCTLVSILIDFRIITYSFLNIELNTFTLSTCPGQKPAFVRHHQVMHPKSKTLVRSSLLYLIKSSLLRQFEYLNHEPFKLLKNAQWL